LALSDVTDSVYVALNDMSAKPITQPQRTFQIHAVADDQFAEVGAL